MIKKTTGADEKKGDVNGCYYDIEKALKNKDRKYRFVYVEKTYLENLIRENEELKRKVGII